MRLIFDRARHSLTVIPDHYTLPTSQWTARNNATRGSKGSWPSGVYLAEELIAVTGPAGSPDGAYGEWFLRFFVPERTGMGIHSGRQTREDRLGRSGPEHATLGCIRTTDRAMAAIAEAWELDAGATLTVEG